VPYESYSKEHRTGGEIMGYIAPVTRYDYLQYAKRTETDGEKKPFQFVQGLRPVLPVKYHRISEDQEDKDDEAREEAHLKNPKQKTKLPYIIQNKYKKAMQAELVQKTAAEITGKGRLFNEII
jgi:hypothetical protein